MIKEISDIKNFFCINSYQEMVLGLYEIAFDGKIKMDHSALE